MLRIKFLLSFLLLWISYSIVSQRTITKTYAENPVPIPNPERGFYHHTEVSSKNYNLLDLNTLIAYRENENITQILRVFYLEEFVNGLISEEYLVNMRADFNTIRAAGLKVIVRFAYSKGTSKPYGDATPTIVRNHVFQLKEIWTTHQDVIAVLQTGFVGTWGEWYYTTHFAGDRPWIISEKNWEDRRKLVYDILKILPKDRMIQLRTPGYKMRIFDNQAPLSVPEAFNKENISRVGHHNDCFVASSSDFGTYVNQDIEKPYLEQETQFLPMGGETCALAPPYSDCENAYAELTRFHYSYLNIDYNRTVLNTWREQGCFDEVELNLGYRYVLQEATLQTEVHPKGTFELSLSLENEGFANLYNPRNLMVILQSTSTAQTYQLSTKETVRLWPVQEKFTINIEAGFPAAIVEDTYKVYLVMPDQSPNLSTHPAYSIQFANQDIWDERGWNDLDVELTINANFSSNIYNGDLLFTENTIEPVTTPNTPIIYGGASEGIALLFWGKTEQYKYRRIERSIDGVSFETLTTLPAINDAYKIVDHDEDYYYRFALLKEGEITYSNSIQVLDSSSGTDRVSISTDGLDTDWEDLIPTASQLDTNFNSYVLRTHFALEQAHFAIYGSVEDYSLYLNTDRMEVTGLPDADLRTGMDYKIQNDSLFQFANEIWFFVDQVVIAETEGLREIELPHSLFDNLDTNYAIPIVAILNEGNVVLSDNTSSPSLHIRRVPPDVPINFEVKNSTDFPAERLEITWGNCSFCEGYLLEKSDDGTTFSPLSDLKSDRTFYYHDFLPDGRHYYRIRGYNTLGISNFSVIKSADLGIVSVENVAEEQGIKVWPNPARTKFFINEDYDELRIHNAQGMLLNRSIKSEKAVHISNWTNGLYLLVFKQKDKQQIIYLSKY